MKPGDTVLIDGERRTIVDISTTDEAFGNEPVDRDGLVHIATLRRCDDDPLREIDDEGGDHILGAEYVVNLEPTT